MTYQARLIKTLENSSSVTGIDNTDLIIKLLRISTKEFEKGTVEGRLSSILIYQQLIESCLLNLLKMSQLLVQIKIYPSQIEFKIDNKMMFGQIIKAHGSTISFNNKETFLAKCSQFNRTRIELVHKLFQINQPEDVLQITNSIDTQFYQIIDSWSIAHEEIYQKIKEVKKSPNIKELYAEFNS
ncbi:MAG: hypothetical protein GQ574_29360 [Crocinitomix sp.]|nr:hypothetical protein [Crocinitomix sp.]